VLTTTGLLICVSHSVAIINSYLYFIITVAHIITVTIADVYRNAIAATAVAVSAASLRATSNRFSLVS